MTDHAANCRWERTTEAECEYRATHHYCPHVEHACDCPPAAPVSETPREPQGLKAILDESRRAVQPMVDREAEAERWPIPDCICNHKETWHRYDCPKFDARDYTHQSVAAPSAPLQTETPGWEGMIDGLLTAKEAAREARSNDDSMYWAAQVGIRRDALLASIRSLTKERDEPRVLTTADALRTRNAEIASLRAEVSRLTSERDEARGNLENLRKSFYHVEGQYLAAKQDTERLDKAKANLASAREYLSVPRRSILSRAVRGDIESRFDHAADFVGKAQDILAEIGLSAPTEKRESGSSTAPLPALTPSNTGDTAT